MEKTEKCLSMLLDKLPHNEAVKYAPDIRFKRPFGWAPGASLDRNYLTFETIYVLHCSGA